jgi:hypothetical protein
MEEEKNFVLDKNYLAVISLADKCEKIYDKFGPCYWYAGIANIYLGNQEQGTKEIELSRNLGYEGYLGQLADAYLSQNNYLGLKDAYFAAVREHPEIFEYHAYLAFAYKKLGQYSYAKEQALEVIRLGTEEAIKEAKAFIKTLPYPWSVEQK